MDLIEQINLEKLSEGNKKSLYFFHEKFHAKIYHYSFSLVKNNEVAEEITSDVFVRLWKIRSKIDLKRGVDHLLFKITKDFCIDYLRKVSRNKALRNAYIRQCMLWKRQSIEDELAFSENLHIAKRAIENLPPKCRQVFQLRYDKEMTLLQIASELNIAKSTVQKHLHKGSKLVRSHISSHTDLVFFFLISLFL